MKFLLQTMLNSKSIVKFYGTIISLTLLLLIEEYKELFCLTLSKYLKDSGSRSQISLKRNIFGLVRRLFLLIFNYSRHKYWVFI